MTNEELKDLWSQQSGPEKPITIPPEFIWRLAQESARFERTIFWRDAREWLATAFVAGVFLFEAFHYRPIHWLPIVAAVIACLPMTYVAFRRQKGPAPEASQSLTNHLRDSIARVQHQIGLLRSVLWWYLAPLALSVMIIRLDRVHSIRGTADTGNYSVAALLLGAAVFFGIWELNQHAVRKHLEPRVHELEKTLSELA